MGFFSHTIKGFPLDKLYKAVQMELDAEDDVFAPILGAIKKNWEPGVKKVLEKFKDKPSYMMEAFFDGSDISVRVLDDKRKVLDKIGRC